MRIIPYTILVKFGLFSKNSTEARWRAYTFLFVWYCKFAVYYGLQLLFINPSLQLDMPTLNTLDCRLVI